MAKIYARIDERLIHGQVTLAWKNAYQITRYIVVDDQVAQDAFRQKLLRASDDTPATFVTVRQAAQTIADHREDTLLVLAAGPMEIKTLADQGVAFDLCNIGNMHMDHDRVQIGTSVAVSPEEKAALVELHRQGIPLEMRRYPDGEPEALDPLFE